MQQVEIRAPEAQVVSFTLREGKLGVCCLYIARRAVELPADCHDWASRISDASGPFGQAQAVQTAAELV